VEKGLSNIRQNISPGWISFRSPVNKKAARELHDQCFSWEVGVKAARMRESVAHLTSWFSSNRTVREYTAQRYYIPAAAAYRRRAADRRGSS
jgi:peptide methionine sulfoxide reductase MsrB